MGDVKGLVAEGRRIETGGAYQITQVRPLFGAMADAIESAEEEIARLREIVAAVGAKYQAITPDADEIRHGSKHPDDMGDDELALITLPIGVIRRAALDHGGGE